MTIEDRIMTFSELTEFAEKEYKRIDAMFEVDDNYITINVSYEYNIELDRIPNYEALLQWSHHLMGKNWMDMHLIRHFIEKVCTVKGWNLHKRVF